MPLKPPNTAGAPHSSNPEVLGHTEDMRDHSIHLRERHLNTPPCLLENSLGCIPKMTDLLLFAFLESTRHITSRKGQGREKLITDTIVMAML